MSGIVRIDGDGVMFCVRFKARQSEHLEVFDGLTLDKATSIAKRWSAAPNVMDARPSAARERRDGLLRNADHSHANDGAAERALTA